jgi:solute carrier family 20 (sodium-dependent phosphate transporter)
MSYLWIVVVGAIGAFGFGWATGSNDVGNAFGTSVGSGTLTMKQAIGIASVFEFVGAVVLGRVSTNTIAGGIADIKAFKTQPELYAYGMMWTLLVGAAWQIWASYKGLNVSATHSIIGGIMGFSIAHSGSKGVLWLQKDPASFPPYKGVVPIVLSWFISPILTALASAIIFTGTRTLILRREDSYRRVFWLLPLLVLLTSWINIYFVFTKGVKKTIKGTKDDWSNSKAGWIALCISAGLSVLSLAAIPFMKRRIDRQTIRVQAIEDAEAPQDDHEVQNLKEEFSEHTERAFSLLQVFSAMCVIFAHGAGEVGYMAGPLSTIWTIWKSDTMPKSVKAPLWIVLYSAASLVFGLAMYGQNVTQAMGKRLARLTPSRGFAAELATSLVILIATQYGLPTSSSQCITGGVVGVGIAEGLGHVNWKFFGQTLLSWVGTMFVMGVGTGVLFLQGVAAP